MTTSGAVLEDRIAWDLPGPAGRTEGMRVLLALACTIGLGVALTAASASATRKASPGTARFIWRVQWPHKSREQVLVKKFPDRGGLLERVTVSIGGRKVPTVPGTQAVGCVGRTTRAVVQKTWLWDGHNVFVSLLLMPGTCGVAGHSTRVQVAITTVGT